MRAIHGQTRLSDLTDDPERVFRAWPRALARWTATVFWRRMRMPARRRRWRRQNEAAVAPYRKAERPADIGPALALGDFSGVSGLSRAAVYELQRLRREHPGIEVVDLDAVRRRRCPGPQRAGPEVGTLYLLSPPDSYATLLAALPPERIARARRIGLWVWETPIFPADWRFALDVVHEIWTPSSYSHDALASGSGDVPVKLRPHNVTPPSSLVPFQRAAHGISESAFLGVAIMDLCSCPSRKNPWAHIAAWKGAFGEDPERRLLMKVRVSKRTRCVIGELAEMIAGAGNIEVFEREMSEGEIAGLQSAADVYLSLHRAEGYGLNIRECLEAGVEVVATDFSANAEYGPSFSNYHAVSHRLTPYRDWTGHYPDGRFEWAEVSIADAAATLRAAAARRDRAEGTALAAARSARV